MEAVRKKEIKYTDKVFWIILIVETLILFNFYLMMITAADNPPHLNLAKVLFTNNPENLSYPVQAAAYPLYHLSTKVLAVMLDGRYELAGAMILTCANVFAICIVRKLLKKYINRPTLFCRWIIDAVSISCIFFGTLRGPLTDGRFYKDQGSANPWHNPTITFVRPFGLMTYYWFTAAFEKMKNEEECRKELLMFSVFSLLSALAKPSYTIVLLPAAGILVFFYWIRDLKKNFGAAMRMLAAAAPALLIELYYVYSQIGSGGSGKIEIALGSFSNFSFIDVIRVSAAAFPIPLFLLVVCRRGQMFRDEFMQLAYITLLIGWIQMFTLTNGPHGDFSWGYDLSVGLATVMSVGYVLNRLYGKWKMYAAGTIYAMQVLAGLHYFYLIKMYGGAYWF